MMIEKNIPVPPKHLLKHLAKTMEISDSVFFKDTKQHNNRAQGMNLCMELRKLKRKGTCRRAEGGYRVWRLE